MHANTIQKQVEEPRAFTLAEVKSMTCEIAGATNNLGSNASTTGCNARRRQSRLQSGILYG